MPYSFLVIFSIVFCFTIEAQQNLVTNGSFEDTLFCPNGPNNTNALSGWYNPSMATPDYYNNCSLNSGSGIPLNDLGFQNAQNGNAYIGLYSYSVNKTDYREYIQVQLTEELVANEEYCWEMVVSLSDSLNYASNRIGVAFSTTAITDFTSETLLSLTGVGYTSQLIIEKTNWKKIVGKFIAQGGEKFLTIGNFYDDQTTETLQLQNNSISEDGAYYYIDNVFVGICETEPEEVIVYPEPQFPSVFTPNGDEINDLFSPLNSEDFSWKVINRWGEVVFTSSDSIKNWNGKFKGKNCPDGVYFFICRYPSSENEEKLQSGYFHLVR